MNRIRARKNATRQIRGREIVITWLDCWQTLWLTGAFKRRQGSAATLRLIHSPRASYPERPQPGGQCIGTQHRH